MSDCRRQHCARFKLEIIIAFQGKGSLSRNKIGNLEKRENPNIITIDQTQSKFENIGLFEEKSDARIKKNL